MTRAQRVVLLCFLSLALVVGTIVSAAATPAAAQEPFRVGFVLVGPQNDRGWSQAHFEASEYVKENIPNVETIVLDRLNIADRPNVTLEQVVENMVEQGAQMIFTTSDEFGPATHAVAELYPDVTFMHVSGSGVLTGEAPTNVGNVMGRMEYMKMLAGCAAALKTETNHIAYLGPLDNSETRRLAVSTYLGARYCFETYRDMDPADLTFEVTWIGFWFNIPGVTLDPTEVANGFFDNGADVVLSGIDTTEGTVVARQIAERGERVFAVPYDFRGACELASDICLGVPYFNWGPAYVELVQAAIDGTWEQSWDWNAPYWEDINDTTQSAVGFEFGDALTEEDRQILTDMKDAMASGELNLFAGPLNYQDGEVFLAEGETATDEQVWFMAQLLEGMQGNSTPAE